MANMLDDNIRKQVKELFGEIDRSVEVLFFGTDQKERCQLCGETKQLLEEVTSLSEKLTLKSYDIDQDKELAAQYHVDAVPTFVMAVNEGDKLVDYGVRFKGIPAGHEFSTLVNALVIVSKRDSGLSPKTRSFLEGLKQPVRMEVFATPTWPYCPRAVLLAYRMAMESPLVEAEGVDAMEFPELADRYNVSGVPQTTINYGANHVVGAAPEEMMVDEIRKALEA